MTSGLDRIEERWREAQAQIDRMVTDDVRLLLRVAIAAQKVARSVGTRDEPVCMWELQDALDALEWEAR
jgi:hypothetical protein